MLPDSGDSGLPQGGELRPVDRRSWSIQTRLAYVHYRTTVAGCPPWLIQSHYFLATYSPALTCCQRFAQGCESVADGCTERQSRTTGLRFFLPRRAWLLPMPTPNLAGRPRIWGICVQFRTDIFRGDVQSSTECKEPTLARP